MNSQHVGRKNGKAELYVDRKYSQMLRTTHFLLLFDLLNFKVQVFSNLTLSDEIHTSNNFISKQSCSCTAEVRNLQPLIGLASEISSLLHVSVVLPLVHSAVWLSSKGDHQGIVKKLK